MTPIGSRPHPSGLRRHANLLLCAFAADAAATLRGLGWWLRGKKVRGSNAIIAAAARHRDYYRHWIRYVEPALLAGVKGDPGALDLVVWNVADAAALAHDSVPAGLRSQGVAEVKSAAELASLLAGPAGQTHSSLWIVPLGNGDRLSPATAGVLRGAVHRNPDARLVFWDEDEQIGAARSNPWLKGQWDELVYMAAGGLHGACAVRADSLLAAISEASTGGADEPDSHAVLARAVRALEADQILHLPLVLTHREPDSARDADRPQHRRAVLQLWPRLERLAEFEPAPQERAIAVLALPDKPPAVSIIIPTRDKPELLRACLAGIARTLYAGQIEVIVVDNGSAEPAALQLLAELPANGTKVLFEPGEFNFARLNNRAVAAASSDYVCLLNNDIEILEPDWLEQLMRHAVQPGFGAAGALLLYPDGSVQHAGVAIGIGDAAGHIYRKVASDAAGHRWMHRLTREVSAVTAACMVVRRDVYRQVGGMDEANFKVAFNDVDLCLRLAAAGLRNIFVAEAVLVHHESESRGDDAAPANRERFARELAALRRIWHTETVVDPHHSPLFRRSSEQAVLEP